jgi:regulation of enolase protein 1 (concanavalin A-like superfamily)
MVPDGRCFETLNLRGTTSLPPDMEYFTLTAQPGSKMWRDPGLPDMVTAPMVYTALCEPLIVAEVTITANWEMEWDQAGLIIFTGMPPCTQQQQRRSTGQTPCPRWVKAGLQLSSGTLHVSAASAVSASGADLSLSPLLNLDQPYDIPASLVRSIRVKLERMGDALWIWYQNPQTSSYMAFRSPAEASEGWQKVREVVGFFWGVESKNGVWIGCYASRPMQYNSTTPSQGRADDEGNGLWVEYEDLEII